jgi:hypothetical protein
MIEARFTLLSPLSHSAFGADAGNAVPLRRMPLVGLPGAPTVPCVSGNALRGTLRRSLMRELLRVCEIGPDAEGWDRIYAALANGGTIEAAEKRIDPERTRTLRGAVPALSVLGAALYSWLLAGHVRVGICWPVCRETIEARVVPAETDAPMAGELETEYTAVRLPEAEHQVVDVTGVGPMPVTIEVLAAGTRLVSRLDFAAHAPALERAAIAHGLAGLQYLGGKSGSGLGRVETVLSGEDADPAPYRAWLADETAVAAASAAILALPATW